jgi:hypothetical protein
MNFELQNSQFWLEIGLVFNSIKREFHWICTRYLKVSLQKITVDWFGSVTKSRKTFGFNIFEILSFSRLWDFEILSLRGFFFRDFVTMPFLENRN